MYSIGGCAKARVYAEVMARQETVQRASDFSRVVVKVMPNITLMSIMQHQINEESEAIDCSKVFMQLFLKILNCIFTVIVAVKKLH